MNRAWACLLAAAALEIAWAVGVRYTAGWTRPLASVAVVAAYLLTLYPLSLAMRVLPAGTAYAAWVGVGTAGVAAWGMLFFGESASWWRLASIALILAGVIGLKASP